jgi:DNA-binding transcriptional ArsR family regulator
MLLPMAVATLPLPVLRAEFVHGLSDVSRQSILEVLRDGERRGVDIVGLTGLSQPNVSKHLRCLRGCGLVVADKRGREVFYSLPDTVHRVLDLLDIAATEMAPQMASCQLTADTVECCS